MAEEYRISVGIDASKAKDGADTATTALDHIEQKAESAAVKVDKLDVTLTEFGKSADGTSKPVKEVKRSLDEVGDSVESLTSAIETLREAQEGTLTTSTQKLKSALDSVGTGMADLVDFSDSASDKLADLSDEAEHAASILGDLTPDMGDLTAYSRGLDELTQKNTELAAAAAEFNAQVEEAAAPLLDYATRLEDMASKAGEAGDALGYMRLSEIADQFRALGEQTREALEPGSDLLRQFADAAGYTKEEVADLYEKFNTLVVNFSEARVLLDEGKLSLTDYKEEVKTLREEVAVLTPELTELHKAMKGEEDAAEALKSVEDMTKALGDMQEKLGETQEKQEKVALSSQSLNDTMTTLSVTAGRLNRVFFRLLGLTGIAAAFYAAVHEANQFDDALVRLTNMADLSEQDIASLTDQMQELAAQFNNREAEEAAGALAIMSRGYRDAAEAAQILTAANQLADATFSDVRTSASALSQAMAAFEMSAADAEDAAATLAVAAGGSAEAMQQMAFMAGRLGAMLKQAGLDLEDFAVAVSALRQSGMETRRAIMGLTQLVSSLSNLSTRASLRFKEMGIEMNAQRIAAEGLGPVLQEIYEKTEGNKGAMQRLLGSSQAATVALAMMRNEGENYNKAMQDMTEKQRIMADMAERVNATFTKLMSDLRSGLMNELKKFGDRIKEGVLPVLKEMVEHIEITAQVMATGFKVAGVLTALQLVGKALLAVQKHFINTALASERLRLQATMDADAAALAVEVASKRAVAAVETARAKITLSIGKLAVGILTGLIAIDIYKIFRDWGKEAMPALLPVFDAIDKLGSRVLKAITGSVNDVVAMLTMAVKMLATTLKALYGLVLEWLGRVSQGVAAFLSFIPGMEDSAKKLATLGTQWAREGGEIVDNYTQKMREHWQEYENAVASYGKGVSEATDASNLYAGALSEVYGIADQTNEKLKELGQTARNAMQPLPTGSIFAPNPMTKRQFGPAAPLGEQQLQELEQFWRGDQIQGLRDRIAEVDALKTALKNSGESAEFIASRTAVLNKQLSELNLQLTQALQKRDPWSEYRRSVVSAVDATSAALFAYEDRLLAIARAEASIGRQRADQLRASAALDYMEAAKGAALYAKELQTVQAAADPATAALEQWEQAVMLATKAALANADPEVILRFMRMADAAYQSSLTLIKANGDALEQFAESYDPVLKATKDYERAMAALNKAYAETKLNETDALALKERLTRQIQAQAEASVRLAAIEQDGLADLAAKYDPLIANEVERTRALIEMEAVIKAAYADEQQRMEQITRWTEVVNKQYDQQARAIQGNITLADAWKEAWRSAIERIDGSFADLWKSAFSGMKDFMDQLKETFKQVLAEIAHAKITRPMIMKLGRMMTGEPKPGEVVGGGIMDQIKDALSKALGMAIPGFGAAATPAFATAATQQDWVDTLAAGYAKGIAKAGVPGFGGAAEDPMAGLEEIVIDAQRIGGDIQAAMDSISVEGLAKTVSDALTRSLPESVQEVFQTVLGSSGGAGEAAGGLWSKLASIPGMAKVLGGLGKLGVAMSSFGANFMGYLQGGWMTSSQIGAAWGTGTAGGMGAAAGQVAGAAGYGMAAGWATDQLLGQRGNSGRNMAFSAAGGIIGNYFLPGVGALIGGAIGSFVDNAIGGGKEVKDFGYELAVKGGEVIGDFYTKVKKYGSWFSSSIKWKREDLDWWNPVLRQMQTTFKQTRDTLLAFQEELGGSVEAITEFTSATVKISTKGKKPEQVEAEVAQAQIDMMGRQIQAYLGAMQEPALDTSSARSIWDRVAQLLSRSGPTPMVAEGTDEIIPAQFRELLNTFMISGKDLIELNPDLKKAGDAFKNSLHYTAEFIEAFKQLATLTIALNMKPSVEGLELYKKSQATLTEQYHELAQTAVEVAEFFDGTIESITAVTEAFVAQRTAAVQLAMALHETAEEVSKMFGDTAESIRESLMQPQELYDYRKAKAEELAQQMRTVTDPAELTRMAGEINSIVNDLYSGLDEVQRQNMAQGFLDFLDGVDDIVQQQVTQGLTDLDTSAASINEQVLEAMAGTAMTNSQAADNFSASVGQFSNAVNVFAQAASLIANRVSTAPIATTSTRSTYTYPTEVNA